MAGSNGNRGGNWISWEAERVIAQELRKANGKPNIKRIARMAGVSRNTVHRFVTGKRKLRRKPKPEPEPEGPKRVKPYRCECGYMVYLKPCQICAALKRRKGG